VQFIGKQHLPYAAGDKIYGGGRDAPNIGPVDPTGHRERDLKYQARRTAMQRRLKAIKDGNMMSPDVGRII
jgi:hypothetical protein